MSKLESFAEKWMDWMMFLIFVPATIALPVLCTFPLWAHHVGVPQAPWWAKLAGAVMFLMSWPVPILAFKMRKILNDTKS